MGLQDIVRFLLPKEDHFYTFLEHQAEVAHQGSTAMAKFKQGGASANEVRDAVQTLEHDGDRIVHQMQDALARTFVTPLDREDLQSLSSDLDNVLDLTNAAARACVLYGVDQPTTPISQLIEDLVQCTEILRTTVPNLRKHDYAALIESGRAIRQKEKEADAVYREAISALFHDPAIDAKVLLRNREVLQHLEEAIDHCEHVADRLTNLAVKHG